MQDQSMPESCAQLTLLPVPKHPVSRIKPSGSKFVHNFALIWPKDSPYFHKTLQVDPDFLTVKQIQHKSTIGEKIGCLRVSPNARAQAERSAWIQHSVILDHSGSQKAAHVSRYSSSHFLSIQCPMFSVVILIDIIQLLPNSAEVMCAGVACGLFCCAEHMSPMSHPDSESDPNNNVNGCPIGSQGDFYFGAEHGFLIHEK